MKLGTKHLVIGGLVLVTLGQGENVRKSMEKEEIRKSNRTEFQDKIRTAKDEAKEAEELSKIALERANTCIDVFDTTSSKTGELSKDTIIFDSTKKVKLRQGAIICLGLDTAVVTSEGKASQIARVSASDQKEFNKRRRGIKS